MISGSEKERNEARWTIKGMMSDLPDAEKKRAEDVRADLVARIAVDPIVYFGVMLAMLDAKFE